MNELGAAVLGLGIMGKALADNLNEDGLLVANCNRSPRPDVPKFVTSIKDAVRDATLLMIIVKDRQTVSEVIDLIEPLLSEKHIVAQCNTVKPEENIACIDRVESRNAAFVEALIGGSKAAAIQRKIPFYHGGEKAVVDKIEPVLAKISGKRIYVGEVGTASVAKLAMNPNLAIQVEALCVCVSTRNQNCVNVIIHPSFLFKIFCKTCVLHWIPTKRMKV
jgi:3-hydroxyisobutyrate dehydrogenase